MTSSPVAVRGAHRQAGPRSKRLRGLSILVGLVISGALVWQSTQAAFTATTENPGNNWTAGSVTLTDNDSGVAMFSVTGLTPGTKAPRCIEVTYGGTVAADVRLYATGLAPASAADNLGTLLSLKVDIMAPAAAGTVDAACTGFVLGEELTATSTLNALNTLTYVTGLKPTGSWLPAATQTRAFRFTHTLADTNDAQGDTATINLVWEARSTG
jgi:hypothetical protein